ncbi:DUF4267 domain-containing protein [Candidatus Protofrankia californiensis]|uniref:DUF4267 domain-containing protein n=1 Tax=Candidatus Protofrankia californiensis TaxID=1839754 RepID=UPI003204ABE9
MITFRAPFVTYSQRTGLFGVARCVIGVGLLTRPTGFVRLAGVDRVTAERTAWITQLAAARDIALGAGLLATLLRRDSGPVRGWLWAGMFVDMADAAVLLAAGIRRDVAPLPVAVAVVAAAGSVVQAGALVARPAAGTGAEGAAPILATSPGNESAA